MVRELSPELAIIAQNDLNEQPHRLQDDLQHLKDWIAKQPHLKARTDDQWLVGVLRGCKHSLERVKKKLDLYYTLKTTAPDVTLRIRPTDPKFLESLRLGTFVILPKSKELFPRVLLIRAGKFDPSTHHVFDIICMLYYLIQILLVEDDTATVMGIKIATDYDGVTLAHFAQGTPTTLKKMIAVCQLCIHKSNAELLQHLPKEILPAEYGGSGGTLNEIIESWSNKIIQYKPWFEQEEQFGTDESKRPGKAQTASEMFGVGVDGSFRKLDID